MSCSRPIPPGTARAPWPTTDSNPSTRCCASSAAGGRRRSSTPMSRAMRAPEASRRTDPMARVNRALDLLAQGQPIYYEHVEAPGRGGYDAGRAAAGTWADYLGYDAEHAPFAPGELREFVRGLVDAGPTRSGHRTPAVIVSLP